MSLSTKDFFFKIHLSLPLPSIGVSPSLLSASPQPRVRSSEAERVQVVEKELNQVYNRGLLRVLKTKLEQIRIPVPGAQQLCSGKAS